MEYFIIEHGEVWDQVLEILKDKVAEGVEVRLMYDGTLQFASLSHDYPRRMESAGIKCRVFSPIKPALTTYQNNRDHRKILVIDGETAFTGGTNLADEYINRKERFGHWKDTAIMVKGESVKSFTQMFLQLWDLDGYENNYEDYLELYPRKPETEYPGYVIPYADSPLDGDPVGKFVYMNILERATKYVHIMTPYLIIDHDMITALCNAVRRGVQVRIILPHIPDKVYAFALARTHYPYLLSQGVEIYEYTPGFVHAKVFVSDDNTAVVGTINMDYRSLFLHFENAVLLYQAEEIARIAEDFEDTLEKCLEVTPEYVQKISVRHKLLGFVLKIFAPLM
jgi:cardiolipin synthase